MSGSAATLALAQIAPPGNFIGTLTRSGQWWLAPVLALLLLSLRSGPDLESWRITTAQRSECGQTEALQVQRLPMFTYGQDCILLRAHQELVAQQLQGQALVLSGFGRDVRIWVNGLLLREFDPVSSFDSASIPLFLPLPAGMLKPGDNEILFQLRSGSSRFDRSSLGSLLLGPADVLQPAVQRSLLIGAHGAQLSVVVALAILLMAMPIAWSQPTDRSYRWFVAALLGSQVYVWNMAWPIRPLPSTLWFLVAHAGLASALWAISHHALSGSSAFSWYRHRFDGLALLGAVGLLLGTFAQSYQLATIGLVLFRVSLLTQLLVLATFWWRDSADPLGRWLAGAALLCLVLGVADSLRVWGYSSAALTPYVLHWGILYILALLLVGQLKRVLTALASAERSQEVLAAALQQRSEQLQVEFELRQKAEHARSLAEERQRIMRDMHDGVGGQLVALIGQTENGPIDAESLKPQLRRSLDDLRLMIDSLDDACGDLGVALGMLRQRLQPGLQGLPLRTSWQTADLPDLAPCPPDQVLQVMRIVQEAITNAIKHANCRELLISARWTEGWLELTVSDDGVGLAADAAPGRGLPSMRQRAAAIGADLSFDALQQGTRMRLLLAVARAGSKNPDQPGA